MFTPELIPQISHRRVPTTPLFTPEFTSTVHTTPQFTPQSSHQRFTPHHSSHHRVHINGSHHSSHQRFTPVHTMEFTSRVHTTEFTAMLFSPVVSMFLSGLLRKHRVLPGSFCWMVVWICWVVRDGFSSDTLQVRMALSSVSTTLPQNRQFNLFGFALLGYLLKEM